MNEKKLYDSPITYWISDTNQQDSILFIHPAFGNHHCFNSQIDFFKRYFNIILIDIIGHGLSMNVKKQDSILKMSDYLKALIDEENITKIHLVGVSLGAVLIQDFANHHSDYVSSLTAIGGYDINHFDASIQKENMKAQISLMLKALISIKWFAKANKQYSAYTSNGQNLFYDINKTFKKRSFRHLSQLTKLMNKYPNIDYSFPILIGYGEHDLPLAKKASNQWHQTLNNSTLVEFKGAGHIVNLDQPDQFNNVLLDFICQSKKDN